VSVTPQRMPAPSSAIPSPRTAVELQSLIREHCTVPWVEEWRRTWAAAIDQIGRRLGVDSVEVWRQLYLHVPSLRQDEILAPPRAGMERLFGIVEVRLANMAAARDEYLTLSGGGKLLHEPWVVEGNELTSEHHARQPYTLAVVPDDIGTKIESNLHYLQSPVEPARLRAGMYLATGSWPICYASFTPMDRRYKLAALRECLCFDVGDETCLNVARIYGFGKLPRNAISTLLSWAGKRLRDSGCEYLVTAVNPMLGFTGISTLSSGFRPYALSPVAYGYDAAGSYASRRHNPSRLSTAQTPPNILFVRGLSMAARKVVDDLTHLTVVPAASHRQIRRVTMDPMSSQPLSDVLDVLRADLEQAWNRLTRYHRVTVTPDDPVSKGQCGVTSAYIARELSRQGHEVLFCEGDVYFPDGVQPIRNHCWVKIPRFAHAEREIRDLIIDLTADQSGFVEPVICEDDQSLRVRGVIYEQAREVEPKAVDAGHLSERLNTLQKRINELVAGNGG